MLAEKLLVSKENEIDLLKSQVAMYKKNSETLEAKTQSQKIKLNSHREAISAFKVESETKSAEIAEMKDQLASLKLIISMHDKDLELKD